MNELQIRTTNDGMSISRFNTSAKARALEAVKAMSEGAPSMGISDGELLTAIGAGRDELSALGIFCGLWGRTMKFLGSRTTVAISIVSLVVFFDWLIERVEDVWEWLTGVFSNIPVFLLTATARAASSLSPFDERDSDAGPDLSRLSAGALKGFMFGFLPLPVTGALMGLQKYISSSTGGGGFDPSSEPLSEESESALSKLLSILSGNADADDLTPSELETMADCYGTNPSEIRAIVNRYQK
jgi:hypothetical protein